MYESPHFRSSSPLRTPVGRPIITHSGRLAVPPLSSVPTPLAATVKQTFSPATRYYASTAPHRDYYTQYDNLLPALQRSGTDSYRPDGIQMSPQFEHPPARVSEVLRPIFRSAEPRTYEGHMPVRLLDSPARVIDTGRFMESNFRLDQGGRGFESSARIETARPIDQLRANEYGEPRRSPIAPHIVETARVTTTGEAFVSDHQRCASDVFYKTGRSSSPLHLHHSPGPSASYSLSAPRYGGYYGDLKHEMKIGETSRYLEVGTEDARVVESMSRAAVAEASGTSFASANLGMSSRMATTVGARSILAGPLRMGGQNSISVASGSLIQSSVATGGAALPVTAPNALVSTTASPPAEVSGSALAVDGAAILSAAPSGSDSMQTGIAGGVHGNSMHQGAVLSVKSAQGMPSSSPAGIGSILVPFTAGEPLTAASGGLTSGPAPASPALHLADFCVVQGRDEKRACLVTDSPFLLSHPEIVLLEPSRAARFCNSKAILLNVHSLQLTEDAHDVALHLLHGDLASVLPLPTRKNVRLERPKPLYTIAIPQDVRSVLTIELTNHGHQHSAILCIDIPKMVVENTASVEGFVELTVGTAKIMLEVCVDLSDQPVEGVGHLFAAAEEGILTCPRQPVSEMRIADPSSFLMEFFGTKEVCVFMRICSNDVILTQLRLQAGVKASWLSMHAQKGTRFEICQHNLPDSPPIGEAHLTEIVDGSHTLTFLSSLSERKGTLEISYISASETPRGRSTAAKKRKAVPTAPEGTKPRSEVTQATDVRRSKEAQKITETSKSVVSRKTVEAHMQAELSIIEQGTEKSKAERTVGETNSTMEMVGQTGASMVVEDRELTRVTAIAAKHSATKGTESRQEMSKSSDLRAFCESPKPLVHGDVLVGTAANAERVLKKGKTFQVGRVCGRASDSSSDSRALSDMGDDYLEEKGKAYRQRLQEVLNAGIPQGSQKLAWSKIIKELPVHKRKMELTRLISEIPVAKAKNKMHSVLKEIPIRESKKNMASVIAGIPTARAKAHIHKQILPSISTFTARRTFKSCIAEIVQPNASSILRARTLNPGVRDLTSSSESSDGHSDGPSRHHSDHIQSAREHITTPDTKVVRDNAEKARAGKNEAQRDFGQADKSSREAPKQIIQAAPESPSEDSPSVATSDINAGGSEKHDAQPCSKPVISAKSTKHAVSRTHNSAQKPASETVTGVAGATKAPQKAPVDKLAGDKPKSSAEASTKVGGAKKSSSHSTPEKHVTDKTVHNKSSSSKTPQTRTSSSNKHEQIRTNNGTGTAAVKHPPEKVPTKTSADNSSRSKAVSAGRQSEHTTTTQRSQPAEDGDTMKAPSKLHPSSTSPATKVSTAETTPTTSPTKKAISKSAKLTGHSPSKRASASRMRIEDSEVQGSGDVKASKSHEGGAGRSEGIRSGVKGTTASSRSHSSSKKVSKSTESMHSQAQAVIDTEDGSGEGEGCV